MFHLVKSERSPCTINQVTQFISVQSGNIRNHSRGALHLGGSVGLKSDTVSVSCHPANFEMSTPLNRFSITYSHNTFPSVQDILTPLHSTSSSFSNEEIQINIHHTSINPFPSLHRHLSQSRREHTSLCPSKILRPLVSIIANPSGACFSTTSNASGGFLCKTGHRTKDLHRFRYS